MGARGEGVLALPDGGECRILFTNRAIAEAEAALGRSVMAMLQEFEAGSAGITDAAILLRSGMEAYRRDARLGGRPVSVDDAYEVMDQVGFAPTLKVAVESMAVVLSFGAEAEDPNR